ncbi:MAG: Trk system potassium transporter TrkH [Burkholderiaceae bacterium]|nr:MAG: Trk system potassium transporter TrkH [Burkholderiaceae bacterium]
MNIFSLKYFGIFFLIISFFSFFNIIYSYYFNLLNNLDNYILTFILTLIIGFFLIIFKKYKYEKINLFERILIVFIGYLILPVLISIPYYLSLEDIGLINCYFEAISGFTSTGFTIFKDLKELDQTLILWRSSSQWIGGLYFLFSILLLIDLFDENLKRSLTNYISLNSSEIFKQVFKIIIIYLSMTIFIFIMLKLVNLRSYDAYNYSLTIISSGGFLPNNNFDITFSTDLSKIILSISMLFSFFSLFFIFNLIFFKKKNINYLSEDINILIYLLIVIALSFIFFNYDNNFLNVLVSISSSVSNIGISFEKIPKNLVFVFLLLVIFGGSFFSTSSGLRVIKVLTLIKFSINNLLSHSKPNQIYSNKLSLNKISANINDINKYFFAIIIFIISLFLISILLTISNLDFETSFKLGILTIMNTVNSEMYDLANLDFYNFNIFGKISLIIFMIIGRIELLSVIILLKKFLFKN